MGIGKNMIKFNVIKDTIKDGDIIFVGGGDDNIIHGVIETFTKSKYFHCAIAFWMTTGDYRELMVVEAQGGADRRVVSLQDFYKGYTIAVVRNTVTSWEDMDACFEKLGEVPYNYITCAAIGIKDALKKYCGVRVNIGNSPEGEICSEFIARTMKLSNDIVSPQDLFETLVLKLSCGVTEGILI